MFGTPFFIIENVGINKNCNVDTSKKVIKYLWGSMKEPHFSGTKSSSIFLQTEILWHLAPREILFRLVSARVLRDVGYGIDTWRSSIFRITHFTMNLATRRSALHSRERVVMKSPTEIFERCHTSSPRVSITSGVTWRWIKYHMWFSADLCVPETLVFFFHGKCYRRIDMIR